MTSPIVLRRTLLSALFLVCTLGSLAAQDTRGSLVPGTPISLMNGTTVEVQDLTTGSVLWTLAGGGSPEPGKVTAVRRVHADSYLYLKTANREFQATGAHRIALASGKVVRVDTVKPGDKVLLWTPKGVEAAELTSVRLYPANIIAYDLTVEGHRMFLAGGIIVGD